MRFEKHWQSETEYKILQVRDDGISRWVNEDYGQYLDFLSKSGELIEYPYIAPEPQPDPEPDGPDVEERVSAIEQYIAEKEES